MKEAPRTLFMKSKNGQLIKDSQYLTFRSQANCKKKQILSTAVECLLMCCLRSDNWVRELVHCGHDMFFPQCDCEYGFSELLLG